MVTDDRKDVDVSGKKVKAKKVPKKKPRKVTVKKAPKAPPMKKVDGIPRLCLQELLLPNRCRINR